MVPPCRATGRRVITQPLLSPPPTACDRLPPIIVTETQEATQPGQGIRIPTKPSTVMADFFVYGITG